MKRDYYDVLGVRKDASQSDIKEAYRKLVLKYHPDVTKDQKSEAKMQEVNEAYAVLSDPGKRRQYDSFGPEGFGRRFTADDIFRGFNFEDIMHEFQENFGGFGGGGFTGFGPFGDFQEQEQSGVNLYLSFDDIDRGVDREFEVQRYKRCDNCKGNGGEPGSKQIKCNACNGSGRRQIRQNLFGASISMVSTCNMCKGRGRTFEKICRTCKGSGRVLVKERFRIKAEKGGKGDSGKKAKGGFFGVF